VISIQNITTAATTMFKPLVLLLLCLIALPQVIEFSRNFQEWASDDAMWCTSECQPYPHRLISNLETNVFISECLLIAFMLLCIAFGVLFYCGVSKQNATLESLTKRAHRKICKLQIVGTQRGDRVEISVKKSSIEKGAFLFHLESTPDLSEFIDKTLWWNGGPQVRIIAEGPCDFCPYTRQLSLPVRCESAYVYKGAYMELTRLRSNIATVLGELNRRMIVTDGCPKFEEGTLID